MTTSITQCLGKLALTSSSNEKLSILKDYQNDELVKAFFFFTYEPSITYYIKDTKFLDNHYHNNTPLDMSIFKCLKEEIIQRKRTGDAAKVYLNDINNNLDKEGSIILKLILGRDAKVGVSKSTLNKVWKDLITDLPYMRCSLPSGSYMKKWDWSKGVVVQEKMDGMFCRIIVSKNEVKAFTRTGNTVPLDTIATQGIQEAFSVFLNTTPNSFQQWDGEMIVVDSENHIMPREIGNGVLNSICKGEYAGNMVVKFVAWDTVTSTKSINKYSERLVDLSDSINKSNNDNFIKCKTDIVYSYDDAMDMYKEYLSNGSEGVILKTLDMIWKNGTSKDSVKIKLEKDVDLVITGFTEGNGKHTETFGAIMCESSDKLLSVNVSGMTDKVRKEISDNRDSYMNMIIVVKANAIMPPTPNNNNYSLFLPRMVEIRNDKTVADDITQIKQIFDVSNN